MYESIHVTDVENQYTNELCFLNMSVNKYPKRLTITVCEFNYSFKHTIKIMRMERWVRYARKDGRIMVEFWLFYVYFIL